MTQGGLLQLVAYGAADAYLTGKPQITFFKSLYRRHTNFAMESIEQVFSGVCNWGKRVQCVIGRNADLIHRMYLQLTLPSVDLNDPSVSDSESDQFRWLNWIGHNLIQNVYIEIGGQQIDKHYGDWLHIWNELTQAPGKQAGYADMVGNVPELTNLITRVGADGGCTNQCTGGDPHATGEARSCCPEYTLYIPFQFWFNRHAGLALPLIALQYHEVRVTLELNQLQNLCWTNSPYVFDAVNATGVVAASLYVDYVYLDTDERRRFAQVAHEYLIEQLQFTGDESITSASNKIKLSFNHPVKELVWVVQRDAFVACDASVDPWKGQQPFNYTDYWDRAVLESNYSGAVTEGMAGYNPVAVCNVQLNGQDRFSARDGRYFNLVQPFQHHTNIPAVGINVYSFALNPEELQPSGTCNFSRIDTATITLVVTNNTVSSGTSTSVTGGSAKVRIYARNYNVLRIMAGMGGLAYSN
jgi:hypothetical protein